MGAQVVPHEDDWAAELLVSGVRQADVVAFVEPLLLVFAAAVGVCPGRSVGDARRVDGHERGQGDPVNVADGDSHHRCVSAPSPGGAFSRPQPLAGFVFMTTTRFWPGLSNSPIRSPFWIILIDEGFFTPE